MKAAGIRLQQECLVFMSSQFSAWRWRILSDPSKRYYICNNYNMAQHYYYIDQGYQIALLPLGDLKSGPPTKSLSERPADSLVDCTSKA